MENFEKNVLCASLLCPPLASPLGLWCMTLSQATSIDAQVAFCKNPLAEEERWKVAVDHLLPFTGKAPNAEPRIFQVFPGDRWKEGQRDAMPSLKPEVIVNSSVNCIVLVEG